MKIILQSSMAQSQIDFDTLEDYWLNFRSTSTLQKDMDKSKKDGGVGI
jgi:hypothetical protein